MPPRAPRKLGAKRLEFIRVFPKFPDGASGFDLEPASGVEAVGLSWGVGIVGNLGLEFGVCGWGGQGGDGGVAGLELEGFQLIGHGRPSSPWCLVGNGGMCYGDYYWGLYRDYYRDPFPNSLLSTRQS